MLLFVPKTTSVQVKKRTGPHDSAKTVVSAYGEGFDLVGFKGLRPGP